MKNDEGREAYVEAELINGLARQIRIIRQQRGWSQKELAELLGTTQTAVSRLEDPSYGKYSIRTLLQLGNIFNVALFTRFISFSKFMQLTWDTRPHNFAVESFSEESSNIQFYEASSRKYALESEKNKSKKTYVAEVSIIEDLRAKMVAVHSEDGSFANYQRVKRSVEIPKIELKEGK